MGHLQADSEAFGALKLTETARGVLKGETEVMLREQAAGSRVRRRRAKSRRGDLAPPADDQPPIRTCIGALRAWRSEVARQRGVPAYVVLHDATIDGIAAARPTTLNAAARHPRHRRQEARALRRRAVGLGQRRALRAWPGIRAAASSVRVRHCEERSDEAIQATREVCECKPLDCFAVGRRRAPPSARNDGARVVGPVSATLCVERKRGGKTCRFTAIIVGNATRTASC